MSARTAASWQTSLADLSLILFMISAAAISRQQDHLRKAKVERAELREAPAAASASSPEGTPLAVYIAAPGAPPLARWLAQQAGDPRQRLTVAAPYGPASGDLARAMSEAGRLAREAGAAGREARIVVEPGEGPARVVLAFDVAASQGAAGAMARTLLERRKTPGEGERPR
ncbi:hypothetical protein ACLIMP_05500 [Novosphingobium aerophilum]|uniref:hypothetical protein n=1 Tax=Novosphingobium TaxID=165696 RepID=UPI0010F25A22|nr:MULTISPECIES: hypothetical protein [unclassified Novosphingobium]TCM37348.1 hypothetical protein EDF59_11156 [Novosphingobium sp. ST904]WRT93692.1 hypothetical protein U9J33_04045 [Novosphingobium sp. RL4]